MNRVSSAQPLADPYFHDIIREMEAIEPQEASGGLKRRECIKFAGATGAGLVLAFSMGGPLARRAAAANDDAILNAYIRIRPSGEIILYNKAPEIGQGIKTSIPMI